MAHQVTDVRGDQSVVPKPASRPMAMRGAATFALALAALGVGLNVAGNASLTGLDVVVAAVVISVITAVTDIFRAPEQVSARGERSRPWRTRANAQGLMAAGGLALAGWPTLYFSGRLGGWMPANVEDLEILALAFLAVFYAVPLAYPKLASRMLGEGGE